MVSRSVVPRAASRIGPLCVALGVVALAAAVVPWFDFTRRLFGVRGSGDGLTVFFMAGLTLAAIGLGLTIDRHRRDGYRGWLLAGYLLNIFGLIASLVLLAISGMMSMSFL